MRWAGRSAPIIATSSTPVRMPDVPLPDVIAAVISPAPPRGTVTVPAYPSYVLRPGSGVGVWAGYPEMFPVATAGHRTTAGVTFEIVPGEAEIIVDGQYRGHASEFIPGTPLMLPPGHHRVVVRGDGYRQLTFDVSLAVGTIIPYRGSLDPEFSAL